MSALVPAGFFVAVVLAVAAVGVWTGPDGKAVALKALVFLGLARPTGRAVPLTYDDLLDFHTALRDDQAVAAHLDAIRRGAGQAR